MMSAASTMPMAAGGGVKRGRESEEEVIQPGLAYKKKRTELKMKIPESMAKELADVSKLTYSVAARKKTANVGPFHIIMSKNGKWRLTSVCAETGKNKSTFLKRKADGQYSGGGVESKVHAYARKTYGAGFFDSLWTGLKTVVQDVYEGAVKPNIGRVANYALGRHGVGSGIGMEEAPKRRGRGKGLTALGRA